MHQGPEKTCLDPKVRGPCCGPGWQGERREAGSAGLEDREQVRGDRTLLESQCQGAEHAEHRGRIQWGSHTGQDGREARGLRARLRGSVGGQQVPLQGLKQEKEKKRSFQTSPRQICCRASGSQVTDRRQQGLWFQQHRMQG